MARLPVNQVANYFLWRVQPEFGDTMSNLKLQKLLYYAQGFYLVLHDDGNLFDEPIEAWTYGPVVPSVYHAYKDYDAGAIPKPDFDPNIIPDDILETLDEVYNVYGQFSAGRLVEMTHEEPPWRDTEKGKRISLDAMADFFRTLIVDVKE